MGVIRALAAAILAVGLVQDVLAGGYTLPEWPQPREGRRPHARTAASSLTVDVGYALYQGVHNTSTKLNIWKGWVCQPCPRPPIDRLRNEALTQWQHSIRGSPGRKPAVEASSEAHHEQDGNRS